MRRYLELTLAGGKELDLPYNSVLMFEQMTENTNPNFPTARSFLRYQIDGEVCNVILEDKVDDLVLELDINTRPEWIKLTKTGEEENLIYLQSKDILMRQQGEDSCIIQVQVGDQTRAYEIKETRRQIKKWSERTTPPPVEVSQ